MTPDWKKDFEDFQQVEAVPPPNGIADSILARVQQELNPGVWAVFSRLSMIHFFSAILTLSVCPQFGFRVFGEGMGLMHVFMSLGDTGCAIACGGFFLGTSLLIAGFVLKGEEVRTIRTNPVLELGSLTLLS